MTRTQDAAQLLEGAAALIHEAEAIARSERLPLGVMRNIERAREGAKEAAMLMRASRGALAVER